MSSPSPPIPSFTDGTVVHQADLNALASNLTNLYTYMLGGFRIQPPMAVINQTVAQTFTTGTTAQVNYDTALVNTNSMWVAGTPNQVTIQTAGVYLMMQHVIWNNSFSGYRFCGITLNGTTVPANYLANTPYYDTAVVTGASSLCAAVYSLAAGAVLYPIAGQGSGSSQPTSVSGTLNSFISVHRISD